MVARREDRKPGHDPPAVNYDDLNSKQRETLNFHTVAALLAQRGYDCFRLPDDWHGADFIAVHIAGHTRRVQLKPRLSIAGKYSGKGLDVAFPIKRLLWYLVPHDTLSLRAQRARPARVEAVAHASQTPTGTTQPRPGGIPRTTDWPP